MDYFGVEIIWIDSSNNIIKRQLVYNQTHVIKGQVFNISQSFNLSETPYGFNILFYNNPNIDDDRNAHTYALLYVNRTWKNPNLQNG